MIIERIKRYGRLSILAVFSLVLIMNPALAAGEMSGIRSISDTNVAPGDTFTVTVSMTANKDLSAPAITEVLPLGWVVTVKDDGGLTYNDARKQWACIGELLAGDSKTVVYDVTVPAGTSHGTYTITGQVSAYNVSGINIAGDNQITVGGNGGNGGNEPVAEFSANVTSGQPHLTVKFTDLSTYATSWEWDFNNDGVIDSTEQNPIHAYNETGFYTVKLSVSGNGKSATKTKTGYIKVTEQGSYNALEATAVSLSATIIPAISIEVTPGAINFGTLSAGQVSDEHTLHIKNKGATDAKVTAQVTDVARGLYEKGLKLDSGSWNGYYDLVGSGTTESVQASLHVPSDYIGIGSMEGKLVFWAEMK
jgi:PKD repeat protein